MTKNYEEEVVGTQNIQNPTTKNYEDELIEKFHNEMDLSEGCATFEEDMKFGRKCLLAGKTKAKKHYEKEIEELKERNRILEETNENLRKYCNDFEKEVELYKNAWENINQKLKKIEESFDDFIESLRGIIKSEVINRPVLKDKLLLNIDEQAEIFKEEIKK